LHKMEGGVMNSGNRTAEGVIIGGRSGAEKRLKEVAGRNRRSRVKETVPSVKA